jgi:hypothetical protein
MKFFNMTERKMFEPRFEDETLNAEIIAAREKVEQRILDAIPTADPYAVLNTALKVLENSRELTTFIKLYNAETVSAKLVYFDLEEEPTQSAFIVAFYQEFFQEVVYYSFDNGRV